MLNPVDKKPGYKSLAYNDKSVYGEPHLVTLLKNRTEKGFSYLYEHYSGALYTIILGIIADKQMAADVLKDCFVQIYRNIDSYDPEKSRLFTWMRGIATNLAIEKVHGKNYKNNLKNVDIFASGVSI